MADRNSNSADLRDRRHELAATIEMMAAGTGMSADDILEGEEGKAVDQRLDHYAEWLARLEAWPPERRADELVAASGGRRFRP